MIEEKKYSLITLDKGSVDEVAPHEAGDAPEEETIVVSSARGVSAKPAAGADSVQATSSSSDPQHEVASRKTTQDKPSQSKLSSNESSQDDEGVPFQRMQTVIIVCLIAVIVIFLVYFNFLR